MVRSKTAESPRPTPAGKTLAQLGHAIRRTRLSPAVLPQSSVQGSGAPLSHRR